MEILLVIAAVVVIGAIWYVNRDKGADVNGDGKVDLADAALAVQNTVAAVKPVVEAKAEVAKAAVKTAATQAKATTKKATTKAKEAVKKAGSGRGRKPKAK
jgi:hypothetical protein